MKTPILSILVITYNQRDLLKRCLQSVLAQELRVPFEVIVSDDRSTDGTEEWITAYQQEITSRQKKGELSNLVELRYVHCNSDECDPKNVSERCGWNKLTVYEAAQGEYFVNIDADDYLRSTDIYQIQLDMLMAHPECSMCMQDVWQVQDGDSDTNGKRWPTYGKVRNGHVFAVEDIIGDYRALNQCYMTRRHPEDNMRELYGKYFDDTIITQHHLQYGPVVFVDRADYVWVQYKTSITKTLIGDDNLLEHAFLQLHHVKMIPHFKNEFMEEGLHVMIHFFKVLTEKHFRLELTERTLAGYREQKGYIYRVFTKESLSVFDKIRLSYIRLLCLMYKKFGWKNYDFLYKNLV
ncbi:MAG: glycosyltransferase family 2 protein [Prevotellaceae bacterium]|nr:glycosyltransferase family 2 protein [Candidatus Colivivens equi]